MALPIIKCPGCGEEIFPINGMIKTTTSYEVCLRRCEKCEIGFSNSESNPTIIYKDYKKNVPELLREDLDSSLNNSINQTNRTNKKIKFGFSTSEDALTWSFFKYFVEKNKLSELLEILDIKSNNATIDIYLWGTNICKTSDDSNFIYKFLEVSDSFNEDLTRRTEPDVIIKLENKLVFIEVKYFSKNETKINNIIFFKYKVDDVDINEVIKSEHYELFRNWAFASQLSNGGKFELINLAPQKLFCDANSNKLSQFENSLKSKRGTFRKLSWEDILEKVNGKENDSWFKQYLNEKISACH